MAELEAAVERVEKRAGTLPDRPETLTILTEGNLAVGRIDRAFLL